MTVWEPGLGAVAVGSPDAFGMSTLPPDPATIAAVDRLQHEHASRVAAEGAELARALALDAEAHAVPDEVDIADTLLEIARERDAAVVVVASHKISGLRSCVLGSVARKLIDGARRGVRLAGHDPLDEPPNGSIPVLGSTRSNRLAWWTSQAARQGSVPCRRYTTSISAGRPGRGGIPCDTARGIGAELTGERGKSARSWFGLRDLARSQTAPSRRTQ